MLVRRRLSPTRMWAVPMLCPHPGPPGCQQLSSSAVEHPSSEVTPGQKDKVESKLRRVWHQSVLLRLEKRTTENNDHWNNPKLNQSKSLELLSVGLRVRGKKNRRTYWYLLSTNLLASRVILLVIPKLITSAKRWTKSPSWGHFAFPSSGCQPSFG